MSKMNRRSNNIEMHELAKSKESRESKQDNLRRLPDVAQALAQAEIYATFATKVALRATKRQIHPSKARRKSSTD
jgi:hypothetical protein